jgi:hypothetical protein
MWRWQPGLTCTAYPAHARVVATSTSSLPQQRPPAPCQPLRPAACPGQRVTSRYPTFATKRRKPAMRWRAETMRREALFFRLGFGVEHGFIPLPRVAFRSAFEVTAPDPGQIGACRVIDARWPPRGAALGLTSSLNALPPRGWRSLGQRAFRGHEPSTMVSSRSSRPELELGRPMIGGGESVRQPASTLALTVERAIPVVVRRKRGGRNAASLARARQANSCAALLG